MARVFISYASADVELARRIAEALSERGIQVWYDQWLLKPGDNLIQRIGDGIRDADALLVLVSEDFGNSKWAQHELSTWLLSEAGQDRKVILPVRVRGASMPFDLQTRVYFDLTDDSPASLARLIESIANRVQEGILETAAPHPADVRASEHLRALRREYVSGTLVLFCGAGISIEAGIPGWNVLLRRLLTRLFRGESSHEHAEAYQDRFAGSPLIVSQYLKNALGQDYRDTMRRALYADNPDTSNLIEAIRELCRPQRARQSLHSIVTFNFDDLIEVELERHSIANSSIYREGQRALPHELPVYHVHGYLPRSPSEADEHDLVFSEDAYHSQFLDPFSWSNLTQLSHLGNQTCLFVGLSMTDPNLRRLLDVSARKNPDSEQRHFVVRRRHTVAECGPPASEQVIDMANILEEGDSNNLGLNVVWVNSFDEVPDLIRSIAEAEGGTAA